MPKHKAFFGFRVNEKDQVSKRENRERPYDLFHRRLSREEIEQFQQVFGETKKAVKDAVNSLGTKKIAEVLNQEIKSLVKQKSGQAGVTETRRLFSDVEKRLKFKDKEGYKQALANISAAKENKALETFLCRYFCTSVHLSSGIS
jgi:hypothetical protein